MRLYAHLFSHIFSWTKYVWCWTHMLMLVLQDQVSEHLKHDTPVAAPVTILYCVKSKFYQGLSVCVCVCVCVCVLHRFPACANGDVSLHIIISKRKSAIYFGIHNSITSTWRSALGCYSRAEIKLLCKLHCPFFISQREKNEGTKLRDFALCHNTMIKVLCSRGQRAWNDSISNICAQSNSCHHSSTGKNTMPMCSFTEAVVWLYTLSLQKWGE